jgi:hypothetical protein
LDPPQPTAANSAKNQGDTLTMQASYHPVPRATEATFSLVMLRMASAAEQLIQRGTALERAEGKVEDHLDGEAVQFPSPGRGSGRARSFSPAGRPPRQGGKSPSFRGIVDAQADAIVALERSSSVITDNSKAFRVSLSAREEDITPSVPALPRTIPTAAAAI